MRSALPIRRKRASEQGYALVLIMFLLALLVLSTVVASPTILSAVQREKEAEMVWRGRQYTRGIRLYYMKMHRFPTSLEDLTTAKNGLRFMRQAYKDPMNTTDGSWRLIYVGPNGQLIGSLNPNLSFGLFGTPGTLTPTAAPQNNAFGGSGTLGNSFGNSGFGNSSSSFGNSSSPAPATNPAQAAAIAAGDLAPDPNAQTANASDQSLQPHSLVGDADSTNTIGGNIIGVGSKVNKKSFLWYKRAKNYRLFEFVWDPTKDTAIGGASRGIGTPVGLPNTGAPGTVAPPLPNQPQNPLSPQNPLGNPDPNGNPPLTAPPGGN